jgi:hypothetical protein
VVGADLDELLHAALVQPVGEGGVKLGPGRLGQAGIGDLAGEDVLEAKRLLAADRRTLLAQEEVAQEQGLEHLVDVLDVWRDVRDRPGPEDPADDGGALQHELRVTRQPVDTRPDQGLDCVRDRRAYVRALGEHTHRLLDEERVPLGLGEHVTAQLPREPRVGQ